MVEKIQILVFECDHFVSLHSKEKAQDAIFYSYTKHINGFAATLEDSEAAQISS